MHKRYQSFQEIDGSLMGRQANPPGPLDISSPGGLFVNAHGPYFGGMFGPPEQTTDVYSGTGERYISGEYGNLYKPHDHASITDYYNGPQSARTEFTTLGGRPYYWMNMDEEVTKKFVPITDRANTLPHGNGKIENFEDLELIGGDSPAENPHFPSENIPIGEPNKYMTDPSQSLSLLMRPQIRTSYSYKNIMNPQQNNNYSQNIPSSRPITPATIRETRFDEERKSKNIDVITNVDTKISHIEPPKEKHNKKSNTGSSSTLIIFVVILIGCVAFELWTESAKGFLQQNLHKGSKISWTRFLLYAVIASGILFLFMYLAGLRPNNILLSQK